jgi:putative SbcD/Mre11-related phosphoesterase
MTTPLWPHAAALIRTRQQRTMIIADLHIGWEMAVSRRGIYLPSQTSKLLAKLRELVGRYKPQDLIILGDVKHTVATAEMGEWHDVPDFFSGLRGLVQRILVIRGNHDGNLEPLLPENIELLPATGMVLGKTGVFHGHQWPTPSVLDCRTIVMGHVHPVVSLRDPAGFSITRQAWIKVSCSRERLAEALTQKYKLGTVKHVRSEPLQLFIMPSFNDFLGGRPLNERRLDAAGQPRRAIGPILRSGAVDMETAEAYLLDGNYLGTLGQLRALN